MKWIIDRKPKKKELKKIRKTINYITYVHYVGTFLVTDGERITISRFIIPDGKGEPYIGYWEINEEWKGWKEL